MVKLVQVSASLEERLGGPAFLVRDSALALDSKFSNHSLVIFGSLGFSLDVETLIIPTIRNNRYGFAFFIPTKRLKNVIRETDILLIHGFYLFSTLLTLLFSHSQTIYLMPHGSLEPFQEDRSKLRKKFFRLAFRILCRRKKLIFLVASAKEIKGVKEIFPENDVVLAGYGVTEPKYKVEIKQISQVNTVTLGYLSRIHPIKRIDLAIATLPELSSTGLSVSLIVAGDGNPDLLRNLSSLASRLGVQNQVKFIGPVSGEAKELFFRDIDILLLLSDNENFALVIAESIVRGIPVIVRSTVGISEFVREWSTGIIVTNESASEVSEAVTKVVENYSYFSKNCILYREKLEWSKVANHWETIMSVRNLGIK